MITNRTLGIGFLALALLSISLPGQAHEVRFVADNGATSPPDKTIDLGDGVRGYCFGPVAIVERSGAYWFTGLSRERLRDGRGRLLVDGRRSVQPLDWDQTVGTERAAFVDWNVTLDRACP